MSAWSIRDFGLALIGVAAAAALILFLISYVRIAPPLERSAIGMDGLAAMLAAEDQPARTFSGGSALETEAIGLRVLPIFEREVDGLSFSPFVSGEAAYLNPPSRPITRRTVTRKAEAVPTLIVLSKWSDGVRRSGLAHPDFLLNHPDRDAIAGHLRSEEASEAASSETAAEAETKPEPAEPQESSVAIEDEKIAPAPQDGTPEQDPDRSAEADGDRAKAVAIPAILPVEPDTLRLQSVSGGPFGAITLRAPQFMALGSHCEALIGAPDRALLALCHVGDTPFWVLSDPDVLNNHGLHLGENAAAALALIADLSAGGEVLIDYSTQVWSAEEDRRSWWEFLRALQPPFLWFWIAALVLFALAFWRSLVRAEPVRSLFEEGYRGARHTVVAAQARLMRNTGRDGALLRALSRQRALALCDLLLGRDGGLETRRARMLDFVRRRDDALGVRLAAAFEAADAAEDRLAPDQAVTLLNRLETAYEEARLLA